MLDSDFVQQVLEEGIDQERLLRLADGVVNHLDTQDRIVRALDKDLGEEVRQDIAFHVSDWIAEAVGLVFLHLRPDLATDEDIRSIVESLVIHANHHLMAATHLWGHSLQDVFELGLAIEARKDD